MFCTGCGQKLPDSSVKCPTCGKLTNPLSSSTAKAGVKPVKKAAAKKQASPPPAATSKAPVKKAAVKKAPVKKTAVKKQAAAFNPPTRNVPEPAAETPPEPVFMPMDPESGMNTGRAFGAISKDPAWLKKSFLVGIAFIIPILNFFSIGFFVQYARNVSGGIDIPMPEIEFESQWKSGALYFLSLASMTMLGAVVFIILIYFAQLPIIMIFAYIFLIAFSFFYLLYFTAAATLSIIQGNPWLIYNFPDVAEIVTENVTPILISGLLLFALSLLYPFVITTGYAYLVSAHITGQLGKVVRSTSKR